MKFVTRLWRRTERSFATTIPNAMVFFLESNKRYKVIWSFDKNLNKWAVDFVLRAEKADKKSNYIATDLWKRSQRSYATTVPHAILLYIDESKNHDIVWEFDRKLQKWTILIKEVAGR